jgi:hypothetical protein
LGLECSFPWASIKLLSCDMMGEGMIFFAQLICKSIGNCMDIEYTFGPVVDSLWAANVGIIGIGLGVFMLAVRMMENCG